MTNFSLELPQQEGTSETNKGKKKQIGGVKKSVDFRSGLKVVLIPSRHEYREAGLNKHLWWTPSEFKYFQQLSTSEILLMAKQENMDVRAARRKLYQPSHDETQFHYIQNRCEVEMGMLYDATAPNSRQSNSGSILIGNSSPRKLIKAPILKLDDDVCDGNASPVDTAYLQNKVPSFRQKSLGLYPVSSLQNLASSTNEVDNKCETIENGNCCKHALCPEDELDPLLFMESDCLSLCVPLEEDFEVSFERQMYFTKNKLAHLIQKYLPCPMSSVVCFFTTLLFLFIIFMTHSNSTRIA